MKMETKPESSMEPPASPASKTSPSTGRGRQKRSAAREDDRPSKRSSGAGLDTDKPTKKPSSAGRGRQKQVAAEEVEQEPDTNIDKPTHLAPTDDARANQKRPREEDDEEEDYVGSSSKKQARTGCDSQKPTVSQEDNEPASDETPSRPNPSSNTRGTRKQREGRGGNRSGDGIRAPTASRSGNKTRADRERQATEEDQDPKLDNETLTEPDAPINLIKDQEQEADQEHADTDPPTTVRRSGRIKKTTLPFRKEATKSSRTPLPSSAPRQDLKRKASPKNSKDGEDEAEGGEEREEIFDLPDDLLEATLAPWKENELVQCRSWTELESEPVFLGEIMNSWGIEGATVKELLTIEQEALDALPNPVYGLVFLFQYESEDHPMNDKNEDIPWFANQTTSNACASIALMNIVMNIEGLPLGTKLEKLKEDTENLNPPQRGYVIANNPWLRAIHNSYARRIDLLDASLFLQNKFDSASQRKRWASTNKKTKATGAGGATNHYIGFVPVGKSVWHLDGLHREGPVHVGTFEDGQHWTTVVAPILQERMMKCATKNISFSLMALCAKEDPIHHLRIKLATNVRCIHDLQHRWGKVGDASFSDLVSSVVQDVRDDMIFWDTAEELEKYGLNKEEIDHLAIEEMVARVHSIDTAIAAADEWKKLCNQQMDLREDYDDALQGQIERTGCGRTEDFTPFIHEWIKQLDNHYPVLEELFTDAQHEEEIRRSGYDF